MYYIACPRPVINKKNKEGQCPSNISISCHCRVTFENVYADQCAGNAHTAGGGEKVWLIYMYIYIYIIYIYIYIYIYISRYDIKRFIHVSTDEVYGDVLGEGVVENAMFEPTNPYSCSKGSLSIFRYLSTVLMLYFTSVILSYSYYYTCYVLI